MPQRSASTTIYHPNIDTVDDSDFQPNGGERPKIPKGLDRAVRKRVVSILDNNRYLADPQVVAVIRLAQLYERFDELEAEIERVGLTVFDAKKEIDLPNPMIALQMTVQSRIIAQERCLAITIPARHEQIDKADRKPRKKASEKKRGAPALRIA